MGKKYKVTNLGKFPINILALTFVISSLALIALYFSPKLLDKLSPKPYCTLQDSESKTATKSSEQLKKYFNCTPTSIYLKDDTSTSQVQSFRQELTKTKGVYLVKYTSKQDALNNYKEIYKNSPVLIESINNLGNVLPAFIVVYLEDPSFRDNVDTLAKSKIFVESVTSPKVQPK